MKSNVIQSLNDQGFLKNDVISSLKVEYVPWLLSETNDQLDQIKSDEDALNNIIQKQKAHMDQTHNQNITKEEKLKANELERRRL